MGAGKSSVGRALGKQLGWTFEDLDERIERREKRRVAEIFRDAGEAEFRRAEHEALKELLRGYGRRGKSRSFRRRGFRAAVQVACLIAAEGVPTVFLDAGVEELWRVVAADGRRKAWSVLCWALRKTSGNCTKKGGLII